ncbi:MAG: M48 family metallopeptidase [Candidatus Margulisbacteria bacterium]|nr:M48 family metallopeptidase [Candidatus Margulisiibacteriota bacterium]
MTIVTCLKKFALVSIFISIFALLGCNDVMYTSRSRALLIPEDKMMQMGEESYKEIKATSDIITSGSDWQEIMLVGNRLVKAADESLQDMNMQDRSKYFDWEFCLIKNDAVINAFCLPGGKIAVYSGIMHVAKGEAQLAVVMAHEIAHALAQHGNERMSQELLVSMGSDLLNKAIEKNSPEIKNAYNTVYGLGSSVIVLLPYSRLQETEADRIGLILMARAGYNPEAAIYFWDAMNKAGTAKIPEFLSTHPSDTTRMEDIKKFIPEAMKYYKAVS